MVIERVVKEFFEKGEEGAGRGIDRKEEYLARLFGGAWGAIEDFAFKEGCLYLNGSLMEVIADPSNDFAREASLLFEFS